jgi:hypothetical protein
VAVTAALVLLVASVGAATEGLGSAIFDRHAAGLVAGVAMVCVAALPTVVRLRRDPLDAFGIYALATALFLGLTSLAWLGTPSLPGPGLSQTDVAGALRMVALAIAVFGVAAWAFAPVRDRRTLRLERGTAPRPGALVAAFALGAVAVTVSFALGSFGYISDPLVIARIAPAAQALALLATVSGLVVLATALLVFGTRDKRYGGPLVVFVLIQMSFGILSGNKTIVLTPLLFLLLAYISTGRGVPLIGLVSTAVVLFVLIIPLNSAYRAEVRSEALPPGAALSLALKTGLSGDPRVIATDTRDYIFTRFRSIDSIALIRSNTPSPFAFAGGEKYFLLPEIILVPRAVWPGKPTLNDAAMFSHTYWKAPDEIRSSTQLTEIGDLYRNFGLPGVVAGMVIWAGAIAAGLALYRRRPGVRSEFVYIYALVTVVAYVESDLPALIATAGKSLPVAALVGWLLLPGRSGVPGYRSMVGAGNGRSAKPSRMSAT